MTSTRAVTLQALALEVMLHTEVDLRVIGQVVAIGDRLPSGSSRSERSPEPSSMSALKRVAFHRYDTPAEAVICCSWSRWM